MTPVIGGEPGTGQKRLDTAASPAIAGRARQFVGVRRRQRVVAPFAGDRVGADQQAAADDDAAADPGAENRAEYGVEPGRRAVDRLGQGKAVRVVREANLALQCGLDIAGQLAADQPRRVGVLDLAGRGDDRSWNTDPDRGAGCDLVFERRDETGDRRRRWRRNRRRAWQCGARRRWRPSRRAPRRQSWCRRGRRQCGSRLASAFGRWFVPFLAAFPFRIDRRVQRDGFDAYRLLTRLEDNPSV